jgi:ankyrin repeat protein
MDFADDDYDYALHSLDDAFFHELMSTLDQDHPPLPSHHHPQLRNLPPSFFLSQNLSENLQQQQQQAFSKEGKLVIHIQNITGILSSSFPLPSFGTSYECQLILDSITFTFPIPTEAIDNPNYAFEEDFVFDIFEYYGGTILEIILIKKSLFSKTILGRIEFCLHDLILAQEIAEQQHGKYLSLSTIREQHQLTSSTLETFWGYQSVVQIRSSSHHNTHHNAQHHSPISLRLSTRYIPLQKCIKTGVNRRYFNQYKSELHHICMTGSAQIVTSVIELLARKNLLKLALYSRESPDGLQGYNCLELALITRNLPVVKVLLQRAGNLCFGGVNSSSSLLPSALTSSPFEHLGVLHQFLDLSQLFRQNSSHKSSSSSSASCSNTSFTTLSFTPHSSTVDKSFFTQHQPQPTSKHSVTPPLASSHSTGTTNKCPVFQTDQSLSPNEILLYTGGSPIHIAILGGADCLQLVLSFLTKYAQVVTGWEGVSSLAEMVEYTANRYDDITPFMLACLLGDERAVKLLYDLKKPIVSTISPFAPANLLVSLKYISKQTGYTPLMLACYSGNYEIVKLLLNSVELVENQIPVAADGLNAARIANSSSRKVLEKYFQQESLVSLLSCLPLAKDYQGRQAIAIAAMCGHALVVRLLIQRGVSYLTSDLNGMTPLHFGAYYGHKAVCDVIIQSEYRLISRFDSLHQNHQRKNRYILKSNHPSEHQSLPSSQPPEEDEEGDTTPPESLVKNSFTDSGEFYSCQLPANKSQLSSSLPVSSLNFMTRRPNALLRMDLFGNRPADIAIRRCFPEITIRLHIAVLEIYGINHPPTYSNTVNSEPLVLGLIEDKPSPKNAQESNPFCPKEGKGYLPLPTEKNGPIHTKLSSMIPLPFNFLPLKSAQASEKPIESCPSLPQHQPPPQQPIPVSPTNSANSMNIKIQMGTLTSTTHHELDMISLEPDEWTLEDEWALNAAYNFSTTLSFPTPPPSPTATDPTSQIKRRSDAEGKEESDEKVES